MADRLLALLVLAIVLGVPLGLIFLVTGEFLKRDSFDHRIGMAKGLGKMTWTAPIGFIEEVKA